MKKALAIVMALVIALSMSAMAFAAENACQICGKLYDTAANAAACAKAHSADDAEANTVYCADCGNTFANEGEFNKHLALCNKKYCPKCQRPFADEKAYNEHVAACTYGDAKDYVDLTIKDILTMIIDLVKTSAGQWDAIESVVIRLVDFIENIGTGLIPAADVEGAVADLEASLADFEIPGISDLLNQLKAKIKAMYAGEKATTVATTEATTEATKAPDTGSASVGIAAFAAISVAAAAAYVCTKKKA